MVVKPACTWVVIPACLGRHRPGQTGKGNLLAVQVDNTNSPDIPPANETNIAIYGVYIEMSGSISHPRYLSLPVESPSQRLRSARSDRQSGYLPK